MVGNFNSNLIAKQNELINSITQQISRLDAMNTSMSQQLTALNAISGKLTQTITLSASGNTTVNMPDVSNLYTTFRLVGVAAYMTTDGTAGNRFLSLELIKDSVVTGFPTDSGKGVIYSGYQSANIGSNSSRSFLWGEGNSSDNWGRQPITGLNLPNGQGYRWRIRNGGAIAGDSITSLFFIEVK